MKLNLSGILLLLSPAFFGVKCQQSNITYSVISSPSLSTDVVTVVVDGVTFPLQGSYGILYQGQAPAAKTGYHYTITGANNVVEAAETFDRIPVNADTPNEFFNRSTNVYNFTVLPQIMTPISAMNRAKSDLHIYNQIPTIHLWGNETATEYLHKNQLEDIKIKLNMTYFGLNKVQSFEEARISLAGRSSRYASKLSYNIKIKKNESLYGYRSLKLRSMAYDNSYKREMLCHSFLKAIGTPASEFSYVRLFIDKKPVGLFGLIEDFKEPWSSNEFANGDGSYVPGHFYHSIGSPAINVSDITLDTIGDLGYHENLTVYSAGQYKIKDGSSKKKTKSFSELQSFTKFINESTDSTTETEWNKYLDTDGFLRAMAAENLLGFADAYMTLFDNYNVYSDPKQADRMIYVPSDLDTSLGTSTYNLTLMHTGNYTQFPGLTMRPLTKKFFSNKVFATAYQELLLNLTKSTLNPSTMTLYLDSIDTMIGSDVEWDQRLTRLGKYQVSSLVTGLVSFYDMLAPGYITDFSKSNSETILEFITAKSTAVIGFLNQSTSI